MNHNKEQKMENWELVEIFGCDKENQSCEENRHPCEQCSGREWLKHNIVAEYDIDGSLKYPYEIIEVTEDGTLVLKCQTSDVGSVIKDALKHNNEIVGFSIKGCKNYISAFGDDDDEIIVEILKGD